jgi:hypothetical protein
MQTPSPEAFANESQPASAQRIDPVEQQLPSRYRAEPERGPFVPLLLGGLGLAAWFGLQTWLQIEEGSALKTAHASQQQTVDNASKLRQSLDAIAADTQRLADAGNPSARLLVDELRKRGITINPNAPPAVPAPAGK